MIRLDDRVAIITGSGQGLGQPMPACWRKEERVSLCMTQALTMMESDSIQTWRLMLQTGFEKQAGWEHLTFGTSTNTRMQN